jgi:hypothetical protein
LPAAFVSHIVSDGLCRLHPQTGMVWPWASDSRVKWMLRLLWVLNVVSSLVLVGGMYSGRVAPEALLLGGVGGGWLSCDLFHFLPYKYNYPHRLIDWLRNKVWPRNGEEWVGGLVEACLIAVLTAAVFFV